VAEKDFIGGEPISQPNRIAAVDQYQPWKPIQNAVDLKTLGKFVEELGEAIQAAGRCIIQGMDEHNVKEGQSNRLVLQDEIADVFVNADLVIDRFKLDRKAIAKRAAIKKPKLIEWHKMAGCSCGGNPHTVTCPMKPQK
jgi:hypothetical protein